MWPKLIQRESRARRHKTAASAQRVGRGRRCARTRLMWAAEAFWAMAGGHQAFFREPDENAAFIADMRWRAAQCFIRAKSMQI